MQQSPNTIPCESLDEAIDSYKNQLGYRLDMIMPADSPVCAVVSKDGETIRLEKRTNDLPTTDYTESTDKLIISHTDACSSITGRAGMEYRDLIPGRLGGRFIASHIRLPLGGEVPDYVHYHKVRFQMIYCKAGFIKVVYEDCGEPFWLNPGDCVLQPPEIRHRVLESSAGAEVIEIGSPAVHETWVEHEIELPTSQVLPERVFNGQRFVRHIAADAEWAPTDFDGIETRDTGIHAATNGLASVCVLRAAAGAASLANCLIKHNGKFLFYFVLNGDLGLNFGEKGNHLLKMGDSCVIPAGMGYSLRAPAGVEFLEVILPS